MLHLATGDSAQEGHITVTAAVVSTCSVDGAGATLDFESYDPGDENPTEASTFFNFSCTAETVVHVNLGTGNNFQNSHPHMVGLLPADLLEYELYQEDGRTAIFGDQTNHGQRKQFQVLANQSTQVDVYGRIRDGQLVPTGTYEDTVQISFTF